MPPIDSQLAMPMGAPVGPGTMSLATLIDFIIQRTYHDLTVLSEILPRRTDMERKIEIVQFASKTRQLFIRLLALVKWANSASKVDKCTVICFLLEKQSMLFVDTADMLARMSRDTLVSARLPNFSIPCAVDVLTTGTYPRLPACIRDKIVPQDPITTVEKRSTLQRLTQVIQYRLVSSDLPQQMRRLRIENGRVKFLVEYEFEVTLTLMGDSSSIPWRLLDIDILVEDHETGSGKSLVHSLQVNYIHQLIQSRLLDNDKPLHDLYRVLHSFSQSLQLEVLHSQSLRLIRERLGESVRIEEYTVGKCLVISYWREQQKRETKNPDLPTVFKLSIHVCDRDAGKPLQISHTPAISPEDGKKVGLAIRSDHLSVEKLLVQTIEIRTLAKLKDLSKDLQKIVDGKCEIKDIPPSLQVPVISPCLSRELMRLAVDIQRGTLLASVGSTDHPVVQDIEESLNGDRRSIDKLLLTLKLHLALLRCEKSVQHIPAVCLKNLPVVNFHGHPLETLSKHVLYVRLPKHTYFYLVVELDESPSRSVEYKYHLLQVTPTSFGPEDEMSDEEPGPKAYLKAGNLMPLNTFSVTHGAHTKIYDLGASESESITRKRKMLLGELNELVNKKTKGSPYFVSEICYLLATCDERIPLVYLGEELDKRGISHSGIQTDGEGAAMTLSVLKLPDVSDLPLSVCKQLCKDLLSCKFSLQWRPRIWIVEFLFHNNPLVTQTIREQGPVHRVYSVYELGQGGNVEKVVSDFLTEWRSIAHMFSSVLEFSRVYNNPQSGLFNCIDIRSFNYQKLVLLYGPNKDHVVTINWKSDKQFFDLSLGVTGGSISANCHLPVLQQLQESLNNHKSLATLAQVLSDTWSPMSSIAKLSTTPIYTLTSTTKVFLSFTVIPQTSTHVRIAFRNNYVLDVHCRGERLVYVRDGAYSLFDSSKCVNGFSPIQGLKAFLNMYVDEAALASYARRRSTTEDDNPPSPAGIDSLDSMFMNQQSTGSPAARRQDMRFTNPMTPPSNPLTPASPSTARVSGGYPSPAAVFPLASPPSLASQVGASPAALMGTPSPGTLLGANSPGNPHLHVPSPGAFVPTPSPQSMGLHMPSPAASFISPQSMVESVNSPFGSSGLTLASPGARNWPGSPSVPGPSPASRHGLAMSPGYSALHSPQMTLVKESDHSRNSVVSPPSRVLPPRAWAASVPTVLSHEAFDRLLTPGTLAGAPFPPCSPLERFLGCVFMRRNLIRFVQNDEPKATVLACNEPGVMMFKVEALQFRVSLNPNTLQTIHLKATPTPTPTTEVQFTTEDTQVLATYFDVKVACPPYRVNALLAMVHLLAAPTTILKDCIQIMKLELAPPPNLKWSVQWCFTLPPAAVAMAPPGTAAVIIRGYKMFIMLQLTRIGLTLPPGKEPLTIKVPLIYEINSNTINLTERVMTPTPQHTAIIAMLKRFAEFHQKRNECAIFPAVRELMTNLVIPVSQ